ncbi:hypothetical protein ONZ45_g16391 [Pleurotus djamor]|nr:hypothetical protein ONZ45_g16391 [Pleurotus djamor]
MGNCLSANDPISLRDLVTRPDAPSETPMSAETIRSGLANVAATLHSKKQNVSIIAVGGAVNTLLLQDVTKVIAAADMAASKLNLGDHWLNNHTALFIQEGTIQQLYDEAVQQNDVVFIAPGLTVYAAPWQYALGKKPDRLSKPGARSYDMNDAVGYLTKLIQKRGTPVSRSDIKGWAQEFKFTEPTNKLLNSLRDEYKKVTGKDGLVDG